MDISPTYPIYNQGYNPPKRSVHSSPPSPGPTEDAQRWGEWIVTIHAKFFNLSLESPVFIHPVGNILGVFLVKAEIRRMPWSNTFYLNGSQRKYPTKPKPFWTVFILLDLGLGPLQFGVFTEDCLAISSYWLAVWSIPTFAFAVILFLGC